MTENKRFIIDIGEPEHENAFFEYDEHFDDYDFVCWEDDFNSILNKFNELGNENEQLKKENAKLQFELKECSNRKLFSRRELEKENERIKHMIQEAYETERTAIGKNVLKQLLNNIGETNE